MFYGDLLQEVNQEKITIFVTPECQGYNVLRMCVCVCVCSINE